MEKKKVQAIIRKATRRMERCVKRGNPTEKELKQAYGIWSMWIDCLHDRGLIDGIDQFQMECNRDATFREIWEKKKRKRRRTA